MTEGGDREGFVPGLPHLVCKSLTLTKVEQAKWNEEKYIMLWIDLMSVDLRFF